MYTEEEKPVESTIYKKYIWKKEWVRPFESAFSVLLNFCKVNVISGTKAINIIYNACNKNPGNYYDMLVPEWYIEKMQMFIKMHSPTRDTMLQYKLYFCPECQKLGYHSVFHQLFNTKICPFHNIPLEPCRTENNYVMDYDRSSIVYNENSSYFINARNIPHPCLRPDDSIIHDNKLSKCLRFNYIAHIFPEESMIDGDYNKLRQKVVVPYDFLSNISNYKAVKLAHFEGTEDDLLDVLQSGKHPLNAIYKHELVNPKRAVYMSPEHRSSWRKIYIYDYYLYCLFHNLIGKSLDIVRFDNANISLDDTLFCDNMVRVKLSFIWSVKGCWHWQNALNFQWVQCPYSGDNNNYRHVYNGVRLESVKIPINGYRLADANLLLVQLYVIDDMFKYLWKQYKKLASRPQGVSVKTGWQELVIPEYYACKTRNSEDILLYRKK